MESEYHSASANLSEAKDLPRCRSADSSPAYRAPQN